MRNSFNLLATGISVFTAKSIPLIISMYLVLKMSLDDYADWIFLFQCVLLASSGLGTVINTEFSKRFERNERQRQELNIYIGSIDIYILMVVLLTILILLKNYDIYIASCALMLFFLNLANNYILLALRFDKKYNYLLILSILRLMSFLPILLFSNITLEILIVMTLISLSIPVLFSCYKFKLKVLRYRSNNEVIWLFGYGLLTSLFVTFERFFLKVIKIDNTEYAIIVYVVSLVMLIVPLVEIIKQYLVPELYSKYRNKSYSIVRDKRILLFLSVLFLAQAILPVCIYQSLYIFGSLPKFMLEFPSINVIILSFSFAIYSLYHFLNPVFFLSDKSIYLLCFQALGIIAFILIYLLTNSFYLSKLIAFSVVISFVIYYTIKIQNDYA